MCISSYTIVFKFLKKDVMVNSVKCLTQVDEYSKDMVTSIESLPYFVYRVVECLGGGMALSKSKLAFMQNALASEKSIKSGIDNFLKNFSKYRL